MRITAIMNPVAGASRQRRAIARMLSELSRRGADVALQRTVAAGDAVDMAREAVSQSDAVIAIGGDGTVCEVVNGLTGHETPLMIWPTGTENLVAKALGFRPDARLICDCLDSHTVKRVDIGIANGRSFLVVAGIGFDAEVVHRVAERRRGHITHLSYAAPIWRTFWEHRFPLLTVETDDMTWSGRGLAFVGNMSQYALGLPVVRDAVPDDGLLDLLVMPCDHQTGLLGHSLRTLLKIHVGYKGVIYERVKRVRISSPESVPFELDGEATGMLPLEVSVRPSAVRVLVPPGRVSK